MNDPVIPDCAFTNARIEIIDSDGGGLKNVSVVEEKLKSSVGFDDNPSIVMNNPDSSYIFPKL